MVFSYGIASFVVDVGYSDFLENMGKWDVVDWFRIWGANCENVGSVMSTCPPASPSPPPCEALDSTPCAEFYYGASNCSDFCLSSDSCQGHYSCSSNGSVVCLPGWTGPGCTVNVATQSSECTCRDGGTWLNGVCVGEVRTRGTTDSPTSSTRPRTGTATDVTSTRASDVSTAASKYNYCHTHTTVIVS